MGGREKDYEHLGVEGALIIEKGKRGRRTERERAHTRHRVDRTRKHFPKSNDWEK